MSYEEEGKALIDETMEKSRIIWEKYKGYPGKDGPGAVEERALSLEFKRNLEKLRKKYGLPPAEEKKG